MKKFTFVLLTTALLLLAGCNGNKPNAQPSPSESSPVSPTQSQTSPEPSDTEPTEDTTPDISSDSEPQQDTDPTEIPSDNVIISTAQALIGIPFVEGGTDTNGFDNSGFIFYVLRSNGYINCPRMTKDQAQMGTNISYNELKPGDLVFFSADGNGNADFGGIYIGGGEMIYCPMPEQSVKVSDITSDYWVDSFVTAVSLS